MTEKVQNGSQIMQDRARRQSRSLQHDDRQAKRARRLQLGNGPGAARIFRDDVRHTMGFEQGLISGLIKRATGNDDLMARQRQARKRGIHQPQDVVMLRGCGKCADVLLADGEKHTLRSPAKRGNGLIVIRHADPAIASPCLPGRTLEHAIGDAGFAGRGARIQAHLRCKGVGRVDQVRDIVRTHIGRQSFNPAKAANAGGQWLADGLAGAASIGEGCPRALRSQGFCQLRSLARASQYEDIGHV